MNKNLLSECISKATSIKMGNSIKDKREDKINIFTTKTTDISPIGINMMGKNG